MNRTQPFPSGGRDSPSGPGRPGAAPPPRAVFIAAGLLVAAGIMAYLNSFAVPFLYDDATAIVTNPSIRHLSQLSAVLFPPGSLTVSGRPMVNLSLAVNYAVGGTAVWGYHAFNLAVHLLAGLALFGIVRRTLLMPALRERFGAAAGWLALTVAGIWLLHPLQTEAVTYIVQRAESLMGLFYLLTLYCFIRGSSAGTPRGWLPASMVFCFLGMASKEVMVSAPLTVLLYDRIFVAGSFRAAWDKRGQFHAGLAASWLLLAGLVVNTGGNRNGSAGFGQGVSPWTYALTQTRAVVHYLELCFTAHPLVFDYGTAVVKHAGDAVPFALVLALLAAGTAVALWRRPVIGFCGFWFFAILAPSSSVVPIVTEPMAEHRMYLPLAAVIAVVVLSLYAWIRRPVVPVFLAGAVLLGLGTARRNDDYRSALSLWGDTALKCPENARAHNYYGVGLFAAGRRDEALREYQEVLRLSPADADGHYNYATALQQMGRTQEAAGEFEAALRLKPDNAEAHTNYGLLLMQSGRGPEAVRHYQTAAQLKPDDAPTHNNWGIALAQMDRMPEAIDQFSTALQLDPAYAAAHNNLGNAYRQQEKLPEAVLQFEAALRLDPDYAEAHNNLALAEDQLGHTARAVAQYREVIRLQPAYAEAHYHLGAALTRMGQTPEAVAELREALRLKPDHAPARAALLQLHALAD